MLEKPYKKFTDWYASCEFPEETYRGWRKTFFVPDLVLSNVAKRSYLGYKFWDKWMRATEKAYPKHADLKQAESPEQFEASEKILSDLRKEGVAVIPEAFPEKWIGEAREYVLDFYEQAQSRIKNTNATERFTWEDESGSRIEFDPQQSRLRCYFPNEPEKKSQLPQPIQDFMNLPVTHQIIEEYYGMQVTPSRPYTMAEVMTPGSEVQNWHIDCLRKGSKAFLYLTDVEQEHGPFRYLMKTNNPSDEQQEQIYRVGRSGLDESYFDDETNEKFDNQAKIFTAPANTLILFDNRGIHAGSLCTEGKRVVLVNGFRPAFSTRVNPRFLPNLPVKN